MACVPRQAGTARAQDAGGLGRVPVRHRVGEAPDARAPCGSERGEEGGEAGRAAVWAGKVELGRLGRKKKNGGGGKSGPAGLKRLGRKSKGFSFSEKGLKHNQFKFEFKNSNSN